MCYQELERAGWLFLPLFQYQLTKVVECGIKKTWLDVLKPLVINRCVLAGGNEVEVLRGGPCPDAPWTNPRVVQPCLVTPRVIDWEMEAELTAIADAKELHRLQLLDGKLGYRHTRPSSRTRPSSPPPSSSGWGGRGVRRKGRGSGDDGSDGAPATTARTTTTTTRLPSGPRPRCVRPLRRHCPLVRAVVASSLLLARARRLHRPCLLVLAVTASSLLLARQVVTASSLLLARLRPCGTPPGTPRAGWAGRLRPPLPGSGGGCVGSPPQRPPPALPMPGPEPGTSAAAQDSHTGGAALLRGSLSMGSPTMYNPEVRVHHLSG
jgi:hypothetical protein